MPNNVWNQSSCDKLHHNKWHELFPFSVSRQVGECVFLCSPSHMCPPERLSTLLWNREIQEQSVLFQASPPSSWDEGSVDRNVSQKLLRSSEASEAVDKLTDCLSSSLPGHCKERWDCVQGCEETRHPHTHGNIRGIPEKNSPHHRRLHSQLAPAGLDWCRSYGGGGIIVTSGQYDGQLWTCRIHNDCCLRDMKFRFTSAAVTDGSEFTLYCEGSSNDVMRNVYCVVVCVCVNKLCEVST